MTQAQEELTKVQSLLRNIKSEWIKQYELKQKATSTATYMGGNERVQTSMKYDKIASMAVKILEKERYIESLLAEYEKEKKQAGKYLSKLRKPKERDILQLVYFKDFTITQYAQHRGMTFPGAWLLHKRALQNISEIYEKSTCGTK